MKQKLTRIVTPKMIFYTLAMNFLFEMFENIRRKFCHNKYKEFFFFKHQNIFPNRSLFGSAKVKDYSKIGY